MKLRDYQQKCIDDLREGFKAGHKHQVLKLPTAAGKTIIAGEIARSVISKGGRFWFVVDRLELVNQTVSVFEKFGLDVAVIQGHHEKTDYRKPVQVITIQTIVKRWKVIDANPEWRPTMLCIDEAHCIFDGHKQMIRMFNNIPIVAFSATPWAKNMGLMYSNLINGVSTAELMEAGYLCKYEAYAPYTPDMKGVKIQAGDYKIDELDKKINTKEITGDVVKEWIKLGENRQTIVFCINIAHS